MFPSRNSSNAKFVEHIQYQRFLSPLLLLLLSLFDAAYWCCSRICVTSGTFKPITFLFTFLPACLPVDFAHTLTPAMWLLSKYVVIFLCLVKHQRQIQKLVAFHTDCAHSIKIFGKHYGAIVTPTISGNNDNINGKTERKVTHFIRYCLYNMISVSESFVYCIKLKLFFLSHFLVFIPIFRQFFFNMYSSYGRLHKHARAHIYTQTNKGEMLHFLFFFKRNLHSYRL